MMRIAVPPGIGDSLWSLTKIPAIKSLHPDEPIVVCVQNTSLNRSEDFLLHFDFIDEVSYRDFPIHYANPIIDEDGAYLYIMSCKDFLHKYDYLLIANGHLERGKRIEEWYPELDTDLDIGLNNWQWREQELLEAEQIHKNALSDNPFVVFYIGPKMGNTVEGHNNGPLWTLEQWVKVSELMLEHNPDLRFVLVGAQYDYSYIIDLLFEYPCPYWLNLVGATRIGTTYALIKRSKFLLSYQCGIGIFSVYLNHPTGIWWRPYGDSILPRTMLTFNEDMRTAWTPKWAIDKCYMDMIYTKVAPSNIVDECIRRRFI